MFFPPATASRYQALVAVRLAGLVTVPSPPIPKLGRSVHWSERNVTASAITEADECPSSSTGGVFQTVSVELVLQSRHTYTGFSDATVKTPGSAKVPTGLTGTLPSEPSTSLRTWRAPLTQFLRPVWLQLAILALPVVPK